MAIVSPSERERKRNKNAMQCTMSGRDVVCVFVMGWGDKRGQREKKMAV